MSEIKTTVNESVKRQAKDLANEKALSVAGWIRYLVHQEIKKKGGAISPNKRALTKSPVLAELTIDEKKAFYDKCEQEGLTANSLLVTMIRTFINQDPHFLKNELKDLRKAALELSAVGRNLNQLAKAVNEGRVNDLNSYKEIFDLSVKETGDLKRQILKLIEKSKKRKVDND